MATLRITVGVSMVFWLAAGCLGSASLHSGEPSPATAPAWSAQVDELFAKWNRSDSPGCAVGIVLRGELAYSKGFGAANLESGALNTPQTVFETASFSKSLTCACLALLMDEGKVAPDDDIRKFVPEMHLFDPPIRIQDLVRCKSGIWDQVSLPILVGWENAPAQFPHREADFFALLTGQRTLPCKPGTEFRYSSGDYFLLGQVVKRATGKSLGQFARERIFEPLEMRRTIFEEDPTRIVLGRAVGHWKPSGNDWSQWRPTACWMGGGGLQTCIEDLCRWDLNFRKSCLPRGKYLDELLQEGTLLGNRYCLDVDAYLKETDPEALRGGPPGRYRGAKRRQFTGGAWGFSTALSQYPEHGLTAICLSNCDEITAWTMNRQIADLVLADRLEPLPAKGPSKSASDEPTAEVSAADLEAKVGAYRLQDAGQIWRITLDGGALFVTDYLMKRTRLRPLATDRFDPEGPQFYATTQFVFARPEEGRPKRFSSQWDEAENRGRLEFEAVQLVQPNLEQLRDYAGEYVSDELAATYRLAVRDNGLWLRVNSRRWEELEATVRDEFIPRLREPPEGRIITFLRNESAQVTGLSIDYYRVKGVRFMKR